MGLVLDASTLIAWIMRDEAAPAADAAIEKAKEEGAVAPVIWWYEVRNAIAASERRGRLSSNNAADILHLITRLRVEIDRDTPDAIMSVARHHGLTVYDAAYLELALRRALPLATLDGALARAAKAENVDIVGAG